MEKNLLKARIAEKGKTCENIAEEIGLTKSAFSKRINGKVPFTIREVALIKAALSLNETETCKIFL